MKKFTGIFVVVLAVLVTGSGGSARRHPKKRSGGSKHSSVEAKRNSTEQQLHKIQQEIARYESELKEHEKREKHSKETIRAFNEKQARIKAAIAKLEAEEAELQGEKTEVDQTLTETSHTLEARKDAYARSSRELYMGGLLKPIDPDRLLALGDASDPVRMSYYAQVISQAHALDRSRLDSMKAALGESSAELASTIETESEQIGEHQVEQSSIEQKKQQEATALEQIQAKKARIQKLLAERKVSEKKLENIIADLLKKESSRRSARRNRHHQEETEPEFLGPAHGPHSLDWPTSSHHIVQGYGEHTNPELGTVTINLGIDIGTPAGSSVRAAAEGEVALVSSLPSYGTVIVLQHTGSLHTVYADLSGAIVRQGAHVRAGEKIGTSGTSEMSGAALHFEVWKEKNKQNPSGWLK